MAKRVINALLNAVDALLKPQRREKVDERPKMPGIEIRFAGGRIIALPDPSEWPDLESISLPDDHEVRLKKEKEKCRSRVWPRILIVAAAALSHPNETLGSFARTGKEEAEAVVAARFEGEEFDAVMNAAKEIAASPTEEWKEMAEKKARTLSLNRQGRKE